MYNELPTKKSAPFLPWPLAVWNQVLLGTFYQLRKNAPREGGMRKTTYVHSVIELVRTQDQSTLG